MWQRYCLPFGLGGGGGVPSFQQSGAFWGCLDEILKDHFLKSFVGKSGISIGEINLR